MPQELGHRARGKWYRVAARKPRPTNMIRYRKISTILRVWFAELPLVIFNSVRVRVPFPRFPHMYTWACKLRGRGVQVRWSASHRKARDLPRSVHGSTTTKRLTAKPQGCDKAVRIVREFPAITLEVWPQAKAFLALFPLGGLHSPPFSCLIRIMLQLKYGN